MSVDIDLQFYEPEQLEYLELRDIRPNVVDQIKERIEESGYNPARPLRVVRDNGSLLVADGNHRLKAIEELGKKDPLPCVVENGESDALRIAVESNRDEDTYAGQDLFDYLDYIQRYRDELTQSELAEKLGWSESQVKKYSALLTNAVPKVLEIAREYQEGRGTCEVPNGTFNFTEGWFRNSGLYDLDAGWQAEDEDESKHAQLRFMEWFCEEQNCDAPGSQVERKIEELQRVQRQLAQFKDGISEAVDDDKVEAKREEIIRGELSDDRVADAIETLNEGAKDQYHFGEDALEVLRELPENEVDIVVTDPPYGVDFVSRRETENPDYDTGKAEVLEYLGEVFAELERVCKANSHIYVFFPLDFVCEIKELAKRHFKVDETPLIWVKNNHGPMTGGKSFQEMHAHRYETIFIFRMENGYSRKFNKDVSPNVLEFARPSGEDRWHDSQKPQALLEDIITNCTGKGEVVLDPFAGSGSTLLAAANTDRHFIGVERDASYESRFKRELGDIK